MVGIALMKMFVNVYLDTRVAFAKKLCAIWRARMVDLVLYQKHVTACQATQGISVNILCVKKPATMEESA